MRELVCVVAVTGGLMLATVGEWEQTKADSLFAIGVAVLTTVSHTSCT